MLVVAKPFFEAFVAVNEGLAVIGAIGMQMIVLTSVIVTCGYALISAVLVNLKSYLANLS